MTQAVDTQVRQPLRIEVRPMPQSNLAVRERVFEPALIEVIPAGQDTPILVKKRGQAHFTEVRGGELARSQHGKPHVLPPKQQTKQIYQSPQPTARGVSSTWQVRKLGRSTVGIGETDLMSTAPVQVLAEMIGYAAGGVLDELVDHPRQSRELNDPFFQYPENQEVYDFTRRGTYWAKEQLNNAFDNLRDAWYNVPRVSVPEFKLPQFSLPRVELPKIKLPKFDLPEIELPDLRQPNSNKPEPDQFRDILPNFKLPDWLYEFEPDNSKERKRQQEEDNLREREKERSKEPDTLDKTKIFIDQLDEGCVLILIYSRIRFRHFLEYRRVGIQDVPLYRYTPFEPFQVNIDRYRRPDIINGVGAVDNTFGYVSGASYRNGYSVPPYLNNYSNYLKYQLEYYTENVENDRQLALQVQLLKLYVPKTFRQNNIPYHDLNYFLYDDVNGIYPTYYNQLNQVESSGELLPLNNLSLFKWAHAESTCPIKPIRPPIPPLPPTKMNCCSCPDIAVIFKQTLKSLKYKINIPIVTCELETQALSSGEEVEKWVTKVAYKDLEVFAVDVNAATAQAELYRQIAMQARELCEAKNSAKKLSDAVGVDEYPASLPSSFISKDEGFIGNLIPNPNVEIKNLTRLFSWYIERFDELMGQFEIPIEVKDADPTTPGEQPVGIKIPNVAEAIAEILGLLLQSTINTETLVNMSTRTLLATGQDLQQNYKSYMALQTIVDYLGYKTKDTQIKMPMVFSPGKESLEEILKECEQDVSVLEYDEKTNFRTSLLKLEQAAAIIQAVHLRKIDKKGNVQQQIVDIIKAASLVSDKLNEDKKDENEKTDFDRFIDDVEVGFTNYTGISDSQHPYGENYEFRPRVKKIGNQSEETQQ